MASATLSADDGSAIDVEFDSDGAATFSKATSQVAQKGDEGRLVLKVQDPGALSGSRAERP
ncbi:hypothetical protein GCM10009740_20810 [Terrabacter terrae]|uniref:Uncharacterized protein n=1 Tax=Terrabacter terrae TaxID=318434 RepID=A0ABN2U9R1_9MICO